MLNISYRMVDYWVRRGVGPQHPTGSGRQRRWTQADVGQLRSLIELREEYRQKAAQILGQKNPEQVYV
jgi:DNA-binding transcriptional MerR regulator